MNLKQTVWSFLIGLLVLISCARVTAPQGGPKDMTKPTLIGSWPANKELNFAERKIRLEFDERVQANEFKKQLLITPSVENPYTFLTDKNFVEITFENPLEDNTTYFLNFRDALTDITEKNKPDALYLTFSTGPALDTGRVEGAVYTQLTNLPEKNMDVLLYRADDTLTIQKHRPYYVTKTKDNGTFAFQNLKEGIYRIYALGDKNNNLKYDGQQEKIGYIDSTINVTSAKQSVALRTQTIDTRKPFILSRSPFTNLFNIGYNEGLKEITATELTKPDTQLPVMADEKGSTISLFPTPTFSGGMVILQSVDTVGLASMDTVNVTFTGKKSPSKIKGFTVVGGEQPISRSTTLELEFQEPVRFLGNEPIAILEDTLTTKRLKYPDQIKLNPSGTRATVTIATKANRTLRIIPDSTQIQGITGTILSLKPVDLQITDKPSEGNLSGQITTEAKNYWIELLNDRYKVVATHLPGTTFAFKGLKPGLYHIRVKIDSNNDGQWQQANPDLRTPVEPLYFYPDKIEIRANWDLEDIQLKF